MPSRGVAKMRTTHATGGPDPSPRNARKHERRAAHAFAIRRRDARSRVRAAVLSRRRALARPRAGTLNPLDRLPRLADASAFVLFPFFVFDLRDERQGVNIMMFCKEYNARTADQPGMIIPVEITVFEDKSFTFVLKTPPASVLLKKAAGIAKGSAQLEKVGSITKEQLAEIATIKMPDLNAHKLESAMRIVAGTAANMGITIDGWDMETSQREFREEKAALYNMNPDDLKIA